MRPLIFKTHVIICWRIVGYLNFIRNSNADVWTDKENETNQRRTFTKKNLSGWHFFSSLKQVMILDHDWNKWMWNPCYTRKQSTKGTTNERTTEQNEYPNNSQNRSHCKERREEESTWQVTQSNGIDLETVIFVCICVFFTFLAKFI